MKRGDRRTELLGHTPWYSKHFKLQDFISDNNITRLQAALLFGEVCDVGRKGYFGAKKSVYSGACADKFDDERRRTERLFSKRRHKNNERKQLELNWLSRFWVMELAQVWQIGDERNAVWVAAQSGMEIALWSKNWTFRMVCYVHGDFGCFIVLVWGQDFVMRPNWDFSLWFFFVVEDTKERQ